MTRSEESCAANGSYDAALRLIEAEVAPLGSEEVAIGEAGGRVLAAPALARIDAPRQRVAAMDGYAVRQDDLDDGLLTYRLCGSSFAGHAPVATLAPGEAAYIATGAPVPAAAARIIPHELVERDGAQIRLSAPAPSKSHVREHGSDFRSGEVVVPAGRVIDPRALVAIAAADIDRVTLYRRPRVSVITTGDELVPPGAAAATPRAVPDSLSAALLLLAQQWGGEPVRALHAADDPAAILAAATTARDQSDIVLIVGGASRGLRDASKRSLLALGLDLKVDTVAMKPGAPMWYGRVGGAHVVGLPGNPTAAMTVARLLVVPLLTGLGGRGTRSGLEWRPLAAAETIAANGPREAFLCATRTSAGVAILERQAASAQVMLARADMLVRRAADAPACAIGTIVEALPF